MISELTKEQELQIPIYLKKWLDYGYRTTPVDKEKATKAIYFLYEKILQKEKPKYLIFLDSPMACELACNLIKNTKLDDSQLYSQLSSQLLSQLLSQLSSQLGSQLDSQLSSQLYSQLSSQLRSQLGSQLDSQLRSQLSSQLLSQLDSQLDSQLYSQLSSQLLSQLYSQLYSQRLEYFHMSNSFWYWSGYYGFYDYILHQLLPKKIDDFKLYREFIELFPELHQFWLFPEIAFVSDFPKEINVNERGQLHADGKAALLYNDTYSLYSLNGIIVPKSIVKKEIKDFTKDDIVKEKNADVRREIIRKIGINKVAELLDYKVIDSFDGYELITFDIGDGRVRPWLKFQNASDPKITHVEGIAPQIETVKDALCFRNNLEKYEAPMALS